MIDPTRGELWLVNFDPSVGSEVKKKRPAVVLSIPQIGKLPLRIIVPITEWKERYRRAPWFVQLLPSASNGLTKDSAADGFQVKSVSLNRFVRKMGSLSAAEMDDLAAAVALCIGFNP
jgi:mRNA interferase MazF